MILIDDRKGSVELAPYLPQPRAICHLDFADFMWSGNGPDGQVSIGVERKRVMDFLKSMTSGRLTGHQLVGMTKQFDYTYVILEGIIKPDSATGILQTPRGRSWIPVRQGPRKFMAREVYNFINTLQVICGVIVVRTSNIVETAKWLQSCHSWWEKRWAYHRSHLHIQEQSHRPTSHVQLAKPNLATRIANQLTGIGDDRARKLGKAFPTPRALFGASEKAIRKVKGVGPKLAKSIVKELSLEL